MKLRVNKTAAYFYIAEGGRIIKLKHSKFRAELESAEKSASRDVIERRTYGKIRENT